MSHKNQQGTVLISSIFFLMLTALIGLSIMKISMLSVQIAHNDETSMKAFNKAELTLRVGENEVNTLAASNPYTDFNDNDDHFYVYPIDKDNIHWVNGKSAGNNEDGRYIIEYLGMRPIGSESASLKPSGGISGSNLYLSRVIARGNKHITGANRKIRTSFATLNQP